MLASVPGTRQATEAVLLASIPRTARVSRKELKAPDVSYQGEPQFKPIEGSQGCEQAVNTDKDIVKYGDLYYMCFQGVWFMSRAATGPWEVATSVPQQIYTIPASSPVHHVTYVTVEEDDDDEWVTFAYVAAYTGMMVGWGCAVWGSGWYYPPYAYYGGFYPAITGIPTPTAWALGTTRTRARTGAACRPTGRTAAWAWAPRTTRAPAPTPAAQPHTARTDLGAYGEAYNPRTGAYGQTRQGSNVYGNWGSTAVQRGDDWAQTAHAQNYRHGHDDLWRSQRRWRRGSLAHRSGRLENHGRSHGRRRCVRRARRQRLSTHRRRRLGTEQRLRRLEPATVVRRRNRRAIEPRSRGAMDPSAGTAGTTSSAGVSSAQGKQLEGDRGDRTSGNQRTTDRSGWQSSGVDALRCRQLSRRRWHAQRRRWWTAAVETSSVIQRARGGRSSDRPCARRVCLASLAGKTRLYLIGAFDEHTRKQLIDRDEVIRQRERSARGQVVFC